MSSLVLFFVFSAAVFFVFYRQRVDTTIARRTTIANHETVLNQAGKFIVYDKTSRLVANLLFVRHTVQLSGLETMGVQELKKQWVAFADSIHIYDRIQFIDMEGNELIRVDYHPDGSVAVPDSELQNRADQRYFEASTTLDNKTVYISRMHLKVDRGKVVKPENPVIHLTAVYYDGAGVKRGMVVLSYLAKNTLDSLHKLAGLSVGEAYLLNPDGYWMMNSADAGTEWAFMYKDRADINFGREYPDEWRLMHKDTSGAFTTSNGFFSYSTVLANECFRFKDVDINIKPDAGAMRIVSHVSPKDPSNGAFVSWTYWRLAVDVMRDLMWALLWVWIPAVVLGAFFNTMHRRREQIRYQADYDGMTHTLNRRAGIERLRALCANGAKTAPFAICFVDINGLKEINDTLGHAAGDAALVKLVEAIRRTIRSADTLCRLGGDEFMIICPGGNSAVLERIWLRICEKLAECNASGDFPFTLSASHGVTEYRPGDDENEMIMRADRAMYEEKEKIKKEGDTYCTPQS